MTPKERAEQLILKFETAIAEETMDSDKIIKYAARQCALIAVDEILNNDGFTKFDDYLTEFWNDVKSEIENL